MDEPEKPVQRPDTETSLRDDEDHIIRSTNSLPGRREIPGYDGGAERKRQPSAHKRSDPGS